MASVSIMYYYPAEGDQNSGTTEEETEEEVQEESQEVPSISLVPALISIGIIAIFRRK